MNVTHLHGTPTLDVRRVLGVLYDHDEPVVFKGWLLKPLLDEVFVETDVSFRLGCRCDKNDYTSGLLATELLRVLPSPPPEAVAYAIGVWCGFLEGNLRAACAVGQSPIPFRVEVALQSDGSIIVVFEQPQENEPTVVRMIRLSKVVLGTVKGELKWVM